MPSPDSRSFRQLMGCFATGVTVVTANDKDGTPVGLTVNSLTSVSLDPPLVLFCLDKKAHIYPIFKRADHFAVNILSATQKKVSDHFADRNCAAPKDIWDIPQNNCPLLKHTLGWMACRIFKIHGAGDHDIFVGEVVKLKKHARNPSPLLYFHSRYHALRKA
jgi:flavin reductase (DIM6/NTAB) family NADH-FMN oxidoreductase RutF